jgi:hypothetical protein
MAKKARAPWKRSNPRKRAGKASKHLSPREKSAAKARAKGAGRRYPNLVDNMRMAAKKKAKKRTAKGRGRKSSSARNKSASATKTTARKTARQHAGKARERDPRGGLTAAGREAFAEKEGAHLKPGVTKKESAMTA